MEIRPVDLPSMRDALLSNMDTRAWKARELLGGLAYVADAELFHVSAEMTSLAAAAAASMPEYAIAKSDLPAHTGLVYFATPLAYVTFAPGHKIALSGVSWTPMIDSGRYGVELVLHAGRDETISVNEFTEAEAEAVRRGWSRLQPSARHFLAFDESIHEHPKSVVHEGVTGDFGAQAVEIAKQVVTTWNLMSQPLAVNAEARYDRASIRRLAREGKQPAPVRVISLRRPPGESTGGSSERGHHHQWVVRGHWRQQWYPARQVHRPVWIAPHIKGPEGAPLLGGEKVYALRR